MSEPKFTKGPWILGNENNDCCDIDAGETTIAHDRYGRFGSGHAISRDEMLANAKLICAAPDMYRALEAVLALWATEGDGDTNSVEHPDGETINVRKLLSKARGES